MEKGGQKVQNFDNVTFETTPPQSWKKINETNDVSFESPEFSFTTLFEDPQ